MVFRCPTEISSHVAAVIQAGLQFIKYDPVSMHPPRLYSLPLMIQCRTTLLRLKMKMKIWEMKAMSTTMRMENSTSMHRTSYGQSIADWGIAGILTMKIQATKSDDRPPSYWQR